MKNEKENKKTKKTKKTQIEKAITKKLVKDGVNKDFIKDHIIFVGFE